MTALLIGFLVAIIIIITIIVLKRLDKTAVYALTLAGIGFLYVGFTWADTVALLVNAIQAVFFLLFAYFGIKKGFIILSAGYFFHGVWDLIYTLFFDLSIIPPNYPLFCSSLDCTVSAYLLFVYYYKRRENNSQLCGNFRQAC
jgi:hypothetical protein